MKNIVIVIHGIKTTSKYNWMRIFELHFKYDERFKGWIFKRARYGYLWATLCIIPFIRYMKIRWFMRYLRKLQRKYPGASINIVAHSYGTMLSYEAIRRSGKIKINKLILISSIVRADEDFKDTLDKGLIKEIFNYCSYRDAICQFNPFGHSGYWGFLKYVGRFNVYNRRFAVEHNQWFDEEPPDFYKMFREELLTSSKKG